MQKNTVTVGDCLHIMHGMEAASVDLVFTSPPYEAARTYGIGFNLRGQDWVDWAVERFRECYRICRGLTAWNIEGQTRKFQWSATPVLFAADLHRAGVRLRKPPIFHRVGIPGSGGPDWLRNDYEFIVCASNGRLLWSDNTAMGHIPKYGPGGEMSSRLANGARVNQWGHGGDGPTAAVRRRDGTRDTRVKPSQKIFESSKRPRSKRRANGSKEIQHYNAPVLANPGNVIKCNVGGGLLGSPLAHENEAPFPEKLVEFFIRSFCPPGGIVLDPFCGSGTTCAVAKRLGRNFIGIDIRESQIELTNRRLATVQPCLLFS